LRKSSKAGKPWRIRWAIWMRSFANTFPGYSSRTSGYFNDYKKWSQTSLDTTLSTLRAVGLQGEQLNSAQAVLTKLRNMSISAGGQVQAAQVGNQIAETAGGTTDGASPVDVGRFTE